MVFFVLVLVLAGAALLAYVLGKSSRETNAVLAAPGTFKTIEEAQKSVPFDIPNPRNLDGWQLKGVDVAGAETLIMGEGPIDKGRLASFRIVQAVYVHSATRTEVRLSAYLNPGVELEHGPDNPGTTHRDVRIRDRRAILEEVAPTERVTPAGRAGTLHTFMVQWYQGDILIGAFWYTPDDALAPDKVLDFLQSVQ